MPRPVEVIQPDPELAQLAEAIATGNALAFVGAGSSKRVGYPSWPALLDHLQGLAIKANPAEAAGLQAIRTADGLLRAQKYKQILGEVDFRDEVARLFGTVTPQHDDFHEGIIRLPFRHVLTSNYDGVLESAHFGAKGETAKSFDLDQWEESSEFLTSLNNPGFKRRYLHIHGSASRPESIILAKDDYDNRYINETRTVDFLKILLTTQRVVFIGFSLTDAYFMYILNWFGAQLRLSSPRHFAILPQPDVIEIAATRAELRAKYIEPIFYDPADDHAALPILIEQLLEAAELTDDATDKALMVDSVSTLVGELLADQPEARDAALQRIPAALAGQVGGLRIIEEPLTDPANEVDAEIDAIFKYVDQGFPDVAIEQYVAIQHKYAGSLTPRLQYRLEANIGTALFASGDDQGAADSYLQATAIYQESSAARGIEVLGHYLRGDTVKAHELALSLCDDDPEFGRGQSLRVRSTPDDVPFAKVEDSVPESIRGDAEVALALADVASRRSEHVLQEKYARLALEASAEWTDAMSALAAALLESEKRTADIVIEQGLVPLDAERVEEAEQLLTRAIDLIPATDPMNRLAGLHFNRGMARRLLGNRTDAKLDTLRASHLSPEEPEIAMAVAVGAETNDEIDRAISLLDDLDATPEYIVRVQFLQAWLLDRREEPGDVDRAIQILEELVRQLDQVEPAQYRFDVVGLAIRLMIKHGRVENAGELITTIPTGSMHAALIEVSQGRVAQQASDPEPACEHSRRAAELLDEENSWLDRREVANLAQDLGLFQEAFAIWRNLLTAVRWNEDVMSLLRCAYFAGEEKFILDFCESARANGVREQALLELEVETLLRWRELDRAVARLQEWLEHNPEDKDVRLTLSLVAIQAGLPELLEGDPRRLPSVEEVKTAARGAVCADVLRRSERPEAGVRYAYSLYRRFPDESVSQVALVRSVLDPTAPPIKLEDPSTAGADAAVLVERDGDAARWIVVETEGAPSAARNEYSPAHALAVAIAGTVPGDTVQYQGREYRIGAIENKVLHRVHQIMERFEEDFPQTPFLRRFRLPEGVSEDAPTSEKLGEIWDQLQSFDEQRRLTEDLYREHLMPLAMIAERLGRSVLDTVRHFAASPTLDIRASLGDSNTWNVAVESCGRGTEVVLDAVGLATVQMLGLHEHLAEMGLQLVVPRSVLDELRNASLNAAGGKQRGYMGVVNGRFFIEEVTPEQIAAEVERLESLVGFIQSECEVVGGAALLAVAEPLRTDLCKVAGIACADAIAIAKERAALLWTDDVAIAGLAAQQELQVRSAWTQTILVRAVKDGAISIDTYTRCLAQLIVARYWFTRIASQDIVALLKQAKWKADSPVGKAIADLIGKVGIAGTHNELISMAGLALLWFTAPDERVGRQVVIGLLERIQPPAARFHLARRIYRAHGLPVDRLKLRRLKRMLRHWRSGDGPFKPRFVR